MFEGIELYWYWGIAGLVLLILELITPVGGIIMMFGLAGLVTALATWLGVSALWGQLAIFALFSVIFWFLVKKKMEGVTLDADKENNSLVSEEAEVTAAIKPGDKGKVELRGTLWEARNVGDSLLQKGDSCVVVKQDSLLLEVKEN